MTREEAIANLNMISVAFVDPVTKEHRKLINDTFEMAIKALSQEPCDDVVSREMALEKMADYVASGCADSVEDFEEYSKIICQLPPVTQKSGKWIPVSERLPEDEQEILFSTKTGRVHSGKYHDDDSANQWYSHRDKCRAWNNVVIAWMPLPKPYEPQERSE